MSSSAPASDDGAFLSPYLSDPSAATPPSEPDSPSDHSSTADDAPSVETSSQRSFVSVSTTSSRSSSADTHCPSPDTSLGLPPRLSRALSSTEYAGSPYVFGEFALPPPGLCVHHMTNPLAFPLLPSQAEQLASLASICPHALGLETFVSTDVSDCLKIEPAMLTFENPEWPEKLDELLGRVCFDLGLPKKAVKYDLSGLQLYKAGAGGHVDMHVDSGNAQGMFATCTVQLPSHFKGGTQLFRHDGREEAFCAGADDGTNQFKCFYSVFYGDVAHEIRPLEEGYRLTLVYKLSWIGNGKPPSVNPKDLAEVKAAMEEHSKMSPDGDWHLAFMLEHDYTLAPICGTLVLKGLDRRKANALSEAALSLGIGELDFVMCQLDKRHSVRGGREYASPPGIGYATNLSVGETYRSNSKAFRADVDTLQQILDWVDWEFVSFAKVKERGPVRVPTGSEELKFKTLYHAMAVVVWARERRIEAVFRSPYFDIVYFLGDSGPVEMSDARADRMLGCLQRGNVPGNAWDRTRAVLEFCLERGLHVQALRAVSFAATLSCGKDMDKILFQYVSRYGWDVIGDAVGRYLCSSDERMKVHKAEPLWTLFQLLPWIPTGTAVDCLTVIMKTVKLHYPNSSRMCRSYECRREGWRSGKLWVTLMSIVASLEQRCNDVDIDEKAGLDSIVRDIVSVLGGMKEKKIAGVYEALANNVIEKASERLDEFHAISKKRLLTFRRRRFESDAKYIMKYETVGAYGGESEDDNFRRKKYCISHEYRSAEHRAHDWSVFLSLCTTVFVGKKVSSTTSKFGGEADGWNRAFLLRDLLEGLEWLAKKDIDALGIAVSSLRCDSEEEEFYTKLEKRVRQAQVKIYEELSGSSEEVDEGSSGHS